ncbi:MAG: hypothetical protein AB7U73_14810 [Pirellulales bacterium]
MPISMPTTIEPAPQPTPRLDHKPRDLTDNESKLLQSLPLTGRRKINGCGRTAGLDPSERREALYGLYMLGYVDVGVDVSRRAFGTLYVARATPEAHDWTQDESSVPALLSYVQESRDYLVQQFAPPAVEAEADIHPDEATVLRYIRQAGLVSAHELYATLRDKVAVLDCRLETLTKRHLIGASFGRGGILYFARWPSDAGYVIPPELVKQWPECRVRD